MLCLHGEPVATSTTENGTFWFCNQPSSCHLVYSEDQTYLYDKAVKEFLATKQPLPKCCKVEDANLKQAPDGSVWCERNYAKMRVVTDMEKASFARPFFVCSKEDDKCNYFEWGDERIIPKPLCKHGKPCRLQKVKKEGRNKDRNFLCCAEPKEKSCKFFKWINKSRPREDIEDPLEPGCIVLFSNPPSYKYTVKKTGAMFMSDKSDRKKAYGEFLRQNENPEASTRSSSLFGPPCSAPQKGPSLFGSTPPYIDAAKKDLLDERFTKRETDDKNETSVCKKRKTLLLHV